MKNVSPWFLATSIACGRIMAPIVDADDGAIAVDAAITADSQPIDAPSRCNPGGAFGAPVPILKITGALSSESIPRLTADELTLYFQAMSSSGNYDLYRASRNSLDSAFGAAMALTPLNTSAVELSPSVSTDGLTLWFSSNRIANEGYHLYVSTRRSIDQEFGLPTLASGVNANPPTLSDVDPFLSADDEELCFTSTRTPNWGSYDLWHTSVKASSGTPTTPEVNSKLEDRFPMLSADRLTMYFSSRRTASGTKGGLDIWRSHRSTVDDGFLAATLVDELNTSADDYATWLSADNCRIYGSSTDPAIHGMFMATRQP